MVHSSSSSLTTLRSSFLLAENNWERPLNQEGSLLLPSQLFPTNTNLIHIMGPGFVYMALDTANLAGQRERSGHLKREKWPPNEERGGHLKSQWELAMSKYAAPVNASPTSNNNSSPEYAGVVDAKPWWLSWRVREALLSTWGFSLFFSKMSLSPLAYNRQWSIKLKNRNFLTRRFELKTRV